MPVGKLVDKAVSCAVFLLARCGGTGVFLWASACNMQSCPTNAAHRLWTEETWEGFRQAVGLTEWPNAGDASGREVLRLAAPWLWQWRPRLAPRGLQDTRGWLMRHGSRKDTWIFEGATR